MDTQLKRGVLDVCVLSAIRERDSYGYQIIKDLSPPASAFRNPRPIRS